ncbi:MAG: kelch repeat-containing protein [Candidatus Eisenbacteria bacterium]
MNTLTPLASWKRRNVVATTLAACLVPVLAWASGPSGFWTPFNTGPGPSGRMFHGSIYDPDARRMVVFGGHPEFLNDVWQLDLLGTGGWSSVPALGSPPSARWGHAAVHDPVRKRMIVMGGYNGANLNDVHALTLTGAPTWSPIAPAGAPPGGRRNHLVTYDALRDRILVFGGYVGPSFVNDLWALNLSGPPVWTQLAAAGVPPSGRSMVGGVYDPVGDRLIIHAGWDGVAYLGDLWELALSGTPTWSVLGASAPDPGLRRDHAAVYDAPSNRVIYFGGYNGSYLGDVWALSLAGSPAWTALFPSGKAPSGRHSHTAVFDAAAHRMVVFGGYDSDYRNDVTALDLTAGAETWGAIPNSYVTSPIRDYAAIYDATRQRAVYFGGFNGAYVARTWALELGPTPGWEVLLNGGPSGRHSHSGVLDVAQDRMLVFGGYDTNYLNDLWSLDLSGPPAWTQLSAAGTPPSPRMYHSAITDPVRQRMIVFGGHPAFLNDVWELPYVGAPQWNSLTPSGTPPAPRWGHCAVYDPVRDQMIVFGGLDATSTNRNDTWALKFSPSLKWVQLPAAGPFPAGRRNTTIEYDSIRDRLLLFGGYGPGFLNDVWELSLSGPLQWTQLSPGGPLPAPRNLITAVFESGQDRLVVHGGWNGAYLADTWFLSFDRPTAAIVSLVRAEALERGVELVWQLGEGSDPAVAVERSEDATEWSRVAEVRRDGTGRVSWTDPAELSGRRVGYRLVFEGGDGRSTGGEVWVEVPSRGVLAIRSIGPNPASDRAVVTLSLPERRNALLEVLDLAGRRVHVRELGMLAPGAHRIELSEVGQLPLGVYLVRLRSGAQLATGRLLVLR